MVHLENITELFPFVNGEALQIDWKKAIESFDKSYGIRQEVDVLRIMHAPHNHYPAELVQPMKAYIVGYSGMILKTSRKAQIHSFFSGKRREQIRRIEEAYNFGFDAGLHDLIKSEYKKS